ncbi:TNC, partial [Symbiodinium necroappetens]
STTAPARLWPARPSPRARMSPPAAPVTQVECPAHSTGTVPRGCKCHAGYSGTISATSAAPFYSGSCQPVACPAHSTGSSVPSGCVCNAGYATWRGVLAGVQQKSTKDQDVSLTAANWPNESKLVTQKSWSHIQGRQDHRVFAVGQACVSMRV